MSLAFFDTNVLVYCFAKADHRMARAQSLLDTGGAISVQCLNEFTSVAIRKLGMTWHEIYEALDLIGSMCRPILPVDIDLHRMGILIAEEKQLSVYDGMIVAAARTAGCDILYSEDMHHGLVIDGVLTITNPFRE